MWGSWMALCCVWAFRRSMLSCLCRNPPGTAFSSSWRSLSMWLLSSFSWELSLSALLPSSFVSEISPPYVLHLGALSSSRETDKILWMSSLSKPSSRSPKVLPVCAVVEFVATIFWVHTMQSIACSRSHWLASGLTCGKLLKKYLWSLRFMASLCAWPKSISCWHVIYILARQWNPWAFFHFTSWDVKLPWQIIFQSSMSSRLLYASSRKITYVELSIIDLFKLFCLKSLEKWEKLVVWEFLLLDQLNSEFNVNSVLAFPSLLLL